MLYVINGNLKEGKATELREWIQENEEAIAENAPPGWEYRGTYFYVLGFGRHQVMDLWECENYADFDTWREHSDETWLQLVSEYQGFFTEDPAESALLREAGDTKIVEPE